MRRGNSASGFTYLTALLLVAAIGFGLTAIVEIWSQTRQREKEAELVWIGNQYRQAIGLYYHRSPGALKRYPEKLEDLLQDARFPSTQRYLRKPYKDPLTTKAEWGLVAAPGGGIMGIYSLSDAKSLKTALGARYTDWRFVYEPPTATR